MTKVNATSPKHIETNPTEASTRKLPETYFSHFLTTNALTKTDKGIDLGFFPKNGDNGTYWSTKTDIVSALCKKNEGIVPSRYGKKVTKLTQIGPAGRLRGNMKFS